MISLVRPVGNSTVPVKLIEEKVSSLNTVTNDLAQMPKIRYVEKGFAVESTSGFGTGIPAVQ